MGSLTPITVVKLGGSYALSRDLQCWVDALVSAETRVVVVPGGGPFADVVRAAQQRMGFDDRAAHQMAVLAMEQYGRALVSLSGRFILASSLNAIDRAWRVGKSPVWSPARMVLAAKEIPWSWDVTADSLAAWLAGRVGAKNLLLVKQVEPQGSLHVQELVARGIVDRAFPRFADKGGLQSAIVGAAGAAEFVNATRSGRTPGSPIGLQ
jgi:aspartokinase-like uncharacterized kinase